MALIAQFIWSCERCGTIEIKTTKDGELAPYSDPTIVPPEGWDYLADGNTHCCAACVRSVVKEEPASRWNCQRCGQLNASWAGDCGRCGLNRGALFIKSR